MTAHFDQVNKGGGSQRPQRSNWITIDDGLRNRAHPGQHQVPIQEKKVFALMGYYGSTPTTEAMNNAFRFGQGAADRHHFRRWQPA